MSRARRPRHPTVGYGHPPEAHRFKPGQSGNPRGRPKGTTSKKLTLSPDPLAKIVLEEASRQILVHDGDRTVALSMKQAIIRRLAVDAAKGDPRAQRLFTEMLALSEAEAQRAAEQQALESTRLEVVFVSPKDRQALHDFKKDA